MRRFELIRGNKAMFWEVDTYDEVVTTRSGRMGKKANEKEKLFDDDMAAEVEFDRLIHEKRRKGYLEVDEASEPPADFEDRAVECRPLDGSAAETFSGASMQYVLWRMVEIQVMDRHREPADLERWDYRATRQLRLDAKPSPGDDRYDEWAEGWLKLSARDRAVPMKDHMIGGFKFREGTHWIVTPPECSFMGSEAANRAPKRLKTKPGQQVWIDAWSAFNLRAAVAGGYEVVPIR